MSPRCLEHEVRPMPPTSCCGRNDHVRCCPGSVTWIVDPHSRGISLRAGAERCHALLEHLPEPLLEVRLRVLDTRVDLGR